MTMESDVWSASAKIAYDFGGFTLTSLTSYQEVEVDQTFDNDLITADLVSANTESGINDTFQQEFQIASNGDGPFRWMAGFYYLDMEGGFGGLKGLQLTGAGVGSPLRWPSTSGTRSRPSPTRSSRKSITTSPSRPD